MVRSVSKTGMMRPDGPALSRGQAYRQRPLFKDAIIVSLYSDMKYDRDLVLFDGGKPLCFANRHTRQKEENGFRFARSVKEDTTMMKYMKLSILLVALTALGGCYNAGSGALVGGGLGAAGGAMIGGGAFGNPVAGALVGAGVGAMTGAIVGESNEHYYGRRYAYGYSAPPPPPRHYYREHRRHDRYDRHHESRYEPRYRSRYDRRYYSQFPNRNPNDPPCEACGP